MVKMSPLQLVSGRNDFHSIHEKKSGRSGMFKTLRKTSTAMLSAFQPHYFSTNLQHTIQP